MTATVVEETWGVGVRRSALVVAAVVSGAWVSAWEACARSRVRPCARFLPPVPRGPHTRVVDLTGRMLLPGFTDGHDHLASLGITKLGVNIRGLKGKWRYHRGSSARFREGCGPAARIAIGLRIQSGSKSDWPWTGDSTTTMVEL